MHKPRERRKKPVAETQKQEKKALSSSQVQSIRRRVYDSLLATTGVVTITAAITALHLYPQLHSIIVIYLFLIIVLAAIRGRYAAFLSTLLSGIAINSFLTPPTEALTIGDMLDPDPLVFLFTALLIVLVIITLRNHVKQAKLNKQEELRQAQRNQELAVRRERQRLALELHDSISQTLYSIRLGVQVARETLSHTSQEVHAPLDYIENLSEAALAQMQALIFELRPDALATEGIVGALSKQVNILRTQHKLAVDAQLGEEPALSLEKKQALYRIAQEALHNIVKHASASKVKLYLLQLERDLVLDVYDNGKGFNLTDSFPGHLGLHSIKQQVAEIKGTYTLESSSQGTHLQVRMKVDPEESVDIAPSP